MDLNLDIIVFGEYTLRQCLYLVGVVAAVFVVIKLIYRLIFAGQDQMQHVVNFHCSGCGWSGRIGKFAARCPKCNQPVR